MGGLVPFDCNHSVFPAERPCKGDGLYDLGSEPSPSNQTASKRKAAKSKQRHCSGWGMKLGIRHNF